jgi:hypothetical protein
MSPIKISGIIRWQEKERERLDYTRLDIYICIALESASSWSFVREGRESKDGQDTQPDGEARKICKIYADTMGPQLRTRLLRDGPVNVVVLHTEISEANKAVPDLFEIGRD